jgi:hypothetical protein
LTTHINKSTEQQIGLKLGEWMIERNESEGVLMEREEDWGVAKLINSYLASQMQGCMPMIKFVKAFKHDHAERFAFKQVRPTTKYYALSIEDLNF